MKNNKTCCFQRKKKKINMDKGGKILPLLPNAKCRKISRIFHSERYSEVSENSKLVSLMNRKRDDAAVAILLLGGKRRA